MELEKLTLEVSAMKAGLTAVDPPVLQGVSGVEHRFDLLFSNGSHYFAFDFFESVSDIEVVRSFAKKFDSRASVSLVCRAEEVADGARNLAVAYGVKIITPDAVDDYFALEKVARSAALG